MDISRMRKEYEDAALDRDSLDPDPFTQFAAWFDEACSVELPEPNAFSLATTTGDAPAVPSLRTVLMKYFDRDGFVFFTNYESAKGREIAANPNVCMLFPWIPMARQVIIKGKAEKVSAAVSLKYFLKRPKESQLGAWVSTQSQVISSRKLLESKLAEIKQRFIKGEMSLPPAWGGYRIVPASFEFWQGGRDRLHDRFLYSPANDADGDPGDMAAWTIDRLSP